MCVEVEFIREGSAGLNPRLAPESPGFTQTLADAVSSVPPRGSGDANYSTYWIDRALEQVRRHRGRTEAVCFQAGNESSLWITGESVRAHSDYELFEDEVMSIDDFVSLLTRWREQVISARAHAPFVFETAYRRNPY